MKQAWRSRDIGVPALTGFLSLMCLMNLATVVAITTSPKHDLFQVLAVGSYLLLGAGTLWSWRATLRWITDRRNQRNPGE